MISLSCPSGQCVNTDRSYNLMKRTALLFAVAILLSGCATVYTKPGKTGADFEKDRKACELWVRKNLAAKGIPDT